MSTTARRALFVIAVLLAFALLRGDAAFAASAFIPDDKGTTGEPGGWASAQWNFAGEYGVGAPVAWGNLIAAGHPGGSGTIVAVVDSGVAYDDRAPFRRSPDLSANGFVPGYDFVARDNRPDDRNGHGTHVASTIAEETNNGYGLTGLAYGARIMPVRVLDSQGGGYPAVIARGIRFAASHGADVINLSLQFPPGTRASEIKDVVSALRYARMRGSLVVAAAGNDGEGAVSYPARAPGVLSVGATTETGCLSVFSNRGKGLDLVAPGGGKDAVGGAADSRCHAGEGGRNVLQVTLDGGGPDLFGIPSDYAGTSMAAPHVAATAALVIASGVLGPHPSPDAVARRIEQTARDLGATGYDARYGWGLVNAAAATAPAQARSLGHHA